MNNKNDSEMYHAAIKFLENRANRLDDDELYHHGVLNQKWGVRRYQNEDGSLTPEGVIHYGRYGETGKRMDRDQKKEYKNTKRELNKYRQTAIERREFSEAADRFAKSAERKYNFNKKVFGEDSKITKRSATLNTAAQGLQRLEKAQLEDSRRVYKEAVQNALDKYGDSRIKDLKNFKTTKTGEEFVRGYSGWQRSFYSYRDGKTGNVTIQGYSWKPYFY